MAWTFYNSSGEALTNFGPVAVSDIANGTDGELITWGTDAAPTTVAAGTSGQVLTSGGANAVPSFQAATGGPTTTLTWTYGSPTIQADTNVVDLDDDGVGVIGVNFTTDYAATTYQALVTMVRDGDSLSEGITNKLEDSLVIRLKEGSTATDADGSLVIFGALV
jgi:hypothetical protein